MQTAKFIWGFSKLLRVTSIIRRFKMPRIVVTHAVKDVDQWLSFSDRTREAFAPYATDVFFYTIPEGGNNVAVSLNVHDMDGLMALSQSPEHQAFTEEAGVLHPQHGFYFEGAG
jgi:hypothetical protein